MFLSKNGLLTLSFPLLSLLQQNKNLPKQFPAQNIWQTWAVWPLWEAVIQPHHTHIVAIAFCNHFIIKLWEASHMPACQNSLRRLNGAHFICNWMQIKISLMRGLKSWKGGLHALSLRIWIIPENMLFLFTVFFCLCHPSEVNKSVSSPFLESERGRLNICRWRAFESFTICRSDLLSPKSERQGWQQLHGAWSRDSQPEAVWLTGHADTSLFSNAACHILSG